MLNNKKSPFLSISIPVYNAEKHIDECIRSIINQDFEDYEVIIVDDGSKDHSLVKCRKWAKKYPEKIRLITNKNQGSLITRRVCISESRGSYVYIMDADDCLLTDKALSIICTKLKTTRCDILVFEYSKDRNTIAPAGRYPFTKNKIYQKEDKTEIYDYIISHDNLNSLWNKVIKKQIIDIDGDYDEQKDICIGTDLFQLLPIITAARTLVFIDDILYYYRTTDNSIIHSFNLNLAKSLYLSQTNFEKHVKCWDIEDKDRKIATYFMRNASSIAYKVRLIGGASIDVKKEFLKEIRETPDYSTYYYKADYKKLGIKRTIIIKMLKLRWYSILVFLIAIMSKLGRKK